VNHTCSKWLVIHVHRHVRHALTVDAGVLHDTMKRISAMELHDVPTLASDELVNEVECLFCAVAEEGAAKSSAKMLTNFLLRPSGRHPHCMLSTSLTIYYPHHSDPPSDTTYRKAMQ